MDKRQSWWRQENGFSLMELTVSLPLFSVLLLSLAVLFTWGIRSYFFMISDWHLQREVQYAMERISEDVRYAERFSCSGSRMILYAKDGAGTNAQVRYELTNEASPRIRRNRQPITGESMLSRSRIEEMRCEAVGENTIAFQIRAFNPSTGHRYELRSAVTMQNRGGAS